MEIEKAITNIEAALAIVNTPLPDITVLWSGGYDSTALLIKYLEEGRKVHTLSVLFTMNNVGQVKAESFARRQILELLREEFPDKIGTVSEVNWPEVTGNVFSGGGLTQPQIWVYAMSQFAATPTVVAGWVKGDEIWHHKADVYNLVDALNRFRSTNKFELLTPFEWDTKEYLLPFYQSRPLVFQSLSTSQDGTPWSLGKDPKCLEMQGLASKLKDLILITPLP